MPEGSTRRPEHTAEFVRDASSPDVLLMAFQVPLAYTRQEITLIAFSDSYTLSARGIDLQKCDIGRLCAPFADRVVAKVNAINIRYICMCGVNSPTLFAVNHR